MGQIPGGTISRVTLPLTLSVQGPVLTRSSSIGALGVDAPMAVGTVFNKSTGNVEKRYYLPGRLIKGLLREAWEELGTVPGFRYSEYAATWLGLGSAPESTEDAEADVPRRGRLTFGDFADFQTCSSVHSLRYRVQIDEDRGAAGNAMLQIIDSPYAPFDTVEFRGEIRWLTTAESEVSELADAIRRGLSWIRAVGGIRTSGFGQVLEVVGEPVVERLSPVVSLRKPSWSLRLRFHEPLILSKRRISNNLFESEDILPGAAIKGAIAGMIERDPASFRELKDELHKVRFTHAFPAIAGHPRPSQIPLSIIEFPKQIVPGQKDQESELRDIIGEDTIGEDGPSSLPWGRAGKFDIDWKEDTHKRVNVTYQWPEIPTELRVRTAIDSSIGKARENALFAWQMLVPHDLKLKQDFEWVSNVEISGLSAQARRQLECLIRFGIEPLGKTRSLASAILDDAPIPNVKAAASYVVVLQTPALLLNPEPLIGSSSQTELESEYRRAWSELSDNSLDLVNYFQRCSLTGGKYFQKRFHFKRSVYKPYLLCDAGSAFLLKPVQGRETDALACLRQWATRGIPLSAAIRGFYEIPDEESSRWKHCPYVPENGYGEVSINAEQPFRPAP